MLLIGKPFISQCGTFRQPTFLGPFGVFACLYLPSYQLITLALTVAPVLFLPRWPQEIPGPPGAATATEQNQQELAKMK